MLAGIRAFTGPYRGRVKLCAQHDEEVLLTTRARGLRLPRELEEEIERERELRGARSFTEVAVGLLREGVRMRRVPGIVFVDGARPGERRACIAGTGTEVWEIAATWRELGEDYQALEEYYDWLPEPRLRAALAYYELYPREIDARLAREEGWTEERVRREMPWATPREG